MRRAALAKPLKNPIETLLAWKDEVQCMPGKSAYKYGAQHVSRLVSVEEVMKVNLEELGTEFEAVVVNPPWNYEDSKHPLFRFEEFVALDEIVERV